jgi:HEXXH motif-containing protein
LITSHRLSQESYDALFSGSPDAEALDVLNAGQRSKHLLLLRMVYDKLPGAHRSTGPAAEALTLLQRVRGRNRAVFDRLIGYPYVAAGLVWCDRQLRAGHDPNPVVGFLAVVAATAAVAAREDFELDRVPIGDAVHLAGLGTCRPPEANGLARLAGSGGDVTVAGVPLPDDLGSATSTWLPIRPIAGSPAGAGTSFDDLDPHRGSGMPIAPYATSGEFAEWSGVFAAATRVLTDAHVVRASQVGAVLQALTPLLSERPGQGRSASAWQAYGAVAVTPPRDAVNFAATLIHETQHSIFNGLLDLFDIYDTADAELYYSPWRADPRPLRGIFHGCYAFLGVADFWSRECLAGVGGPRAEYELVRTCLQVGRALETLDGSRALTADGRHLVDRMAKYIERFDAALPSGPGRHLAGLATEDHRLSWRIRIVIPDPAFVVAAADAWLAGGPCPPVPDAASLATDSDTFVPSTRIRHFGRLAAKEETSADTPADDHLVERDHEVAARDFGAVVRAGDGDQLAAWTGLALAGAHLDGPAGRVWRRRPEVVRAVHRRLSADGREPADPLALADWLAGGLAG